jgi:energy-coupling factor transporter ATP-binding protein EcfA2
MRFVTRGLRVRYPVQERWAIDGIDLDLAAGSVTWLSGALGSGTSTLLLALAGLAPRLTGGEREGTVTAGDHDVADLSPLAAGIAYLGPAPALQISGIAATVRHEVAVGPMNLGWAPDEMERAADAAMRELRVDHLAARDPGALSGGETQRVLLAALLATAPQAWLLDEPFSALDHASTARVQRLLRELALKGASVVVACDDADTMVDVADRLIVLARGRVALDGAPRTLLAGDGVIAAGAGTTDAATVALAAGIAAPRPVTRAELLQRIEPGRSTAMSPAPASRPNGPDALTLSGVAFAYPGGEPVLGSVSLGVGQGEGVGLFGPNGAGKSTLLRLAMALEQPQAGEITVLGQSTRGRGPEAFAPRVAFLFQQPERQLFADTVASECSLAPRLAGWEPGRVAEAVAAVLSELGLSDTARDHPYDLPLPQRRLVALGAILAADPDLILLDEPTAALDSASRDRVIRVVRARIDRGIPVVAITHDPVFAHEALGRGVVLEGGRLVHDGPVRNVIDDQRLVRPAALAVAMLLGLPPGMDRRADVARALR